MAQFKGLPARTTVRRWVIRALEHTPHACLTLRFVGTREGRVLNRQFRNKDYATNVLTFAYSTEPITADIVLCMPVIAREASTQGKSLRAHLAHLVMHGILHARGFDHIRPTEARRMEHLEIKLLSTLRIANPYETAKTKKKVSTSFH